jgi:hypothetical protein
VRDQGQCGSCVSFAYIATAEAAMASQLKLKTNTLDFSERRRAACRTAACANRLARRVRRSGGRQLGAREPCLLLLLLLLQGRLHTVPTA